MCNTLEIPHIEVRLEPERDPEQPTLFSMNVYPETTQLARSYLELLKLFQWNKFCVIYGDQRGRFETLHKILSLRWSPLDTLFCQNPQNSPYVKALKGWFIEQAVQSLWYWL